MIFAASDDPITASHKGAQNRVSTAVRARNRRISAGLPAQYLFGQEIDNEPVAAGEVTHEFGG